MEKIKNYILPENTNRLYKEEAISSIGLTRDVAEKINELVDAYNLLVKMDLEWKQTQEGTIRKGIIYMKDNLVNTIHDLWTILEKNGYINDRIAEHTALLKSRLDNLLGKITEGSTSLDAEVIDGRVGFDGVIYQTIGEAIRSQCGILSAERTLALLNLRLDIDFTTQTMTLSPVNSVVTSCIFGMRTRYQIDGGFEPVSIGFSGMDAGTYNIVFRSENHSLSFVSTAKTTEREFLYKRGDYILATLYMDKTTIKQVVYAPENNVYVNGKLMHKRKYNTFSVLGDSYSTFEGYINGVNRSYYPNVASGVVDASSCWWYIFANDYRCRLLENNSCTGSVISYDGYGVGTDDGKAESFITRMNDLGKPELLIVFGATNDSSVGVSLGNYKYDNFTESDFTTFRPSLAYLLSNLKKKHIGCDILYVINTGLSSGIVESINTICSYYGIDTLQLTNIEKADGHPTVAGMKAIAYQIRTKLGG